MRLAVALIAVIAVATVGQAAAAQPSQFQTTLQLRFWDPDLMFSIPPFSATDSARGWGGSLRVDSRNSPWSFSARYDSQHVDFFNWLWDRANLWDVNFHYRFGPSLNSYVGLLAGYGSASLQSPFAGFSGGASGLRAGVEFLYRQPSGWYVTGEGSYGPSWSTDIPGLGGLLGNARVTDLRIAVGYEFTGGFGLEAGWRYYTVTLPSSSLCSSCKWELSGLTAAVTFRR
jgi:hypothetical protein